MKLLRNARDICSLTVAVLFRRSPTLNRARQQAGSRQIRLLFGLARGLARELSDENAYQRHLQLTGHRHSAAEWRAFSDRRHRRKYQNAKCC